PSGPAAAANPPWDAGPPATPWPGAFKREMPAASSASPAPPAPPASPPSPASSASASEPGHGGPVSSGSHLGMPIRVPQASLSPHLRVRRPADPQAAVREEPAEVDQRS